MGILGTIGNALMGSGGGILSSLFGGGGGGGGSISAGSNSGGGGLGGILNTLAPIAGTALGTFFGGPMGGMLGGNLAGALGNSLFGGGSSQQQPQQQQQQQQYGPQQSYGNQFGTSMGNTLNQGFNQYLPQQMQGQTFGNMGGALGSYFGNKFGMPELGSTLGNMANPYIQKYIPQNMRDVQMGNFGGYLGSQAGQQIDNGFQSRGMNPYQTPNYGNQMSNQMNDYSQSGYGNIPEAPPFSDMYNSGSRGGYYGSANNSNSYPMQEQSGRGAMLNEIRNYRRSAPPQSEQYGNIPEAPPFDLSYSPSSNRSSGFGIRSGFSDRPANIFSEFSQRASQPGMGLRPTQTRSSDAYPSSGGDNMMDLLRNRLGDIRGAVAPNEPNRNYTVRGGF